MLIIGTNNGPFERTVFSSPGSTARPNTFGEFTAPNNEVLINWSAGGWSTVPVSGAVFATNDTLGPWINSGGYKFRDEFNNLYDRVNSRIRSAVLEGPLLVPYVAPSWPVWLARGLGASMHIPSSGTISTVGFSSLQAQYTWALTDGMIVHPDDEAAVSTWVVVAGGSHPVSLKVPFTATGKDIGDTVVDAYVGVDSNGDTVKARGLVVDLSRWLPRSVGSMRMKGFAIRS